jgi:hypothetical protein
LVRDNDIVDQRIIGDVKYLFSGDDGLKHVSSEENLFSQCEFREYQLNKII